MCLCAYMSSPEGLSLGPTSVRSGSLPLCWAVRVEQWQAYEKTREGGGAKASVNQRRHRMLHSKHQLGNVQHVCSICTACCLCGWTEQRANQMCYLYGVKARLLGKCEKFVFDLESHFHAVALDDFVLVAWFRGFWRMREGSRGRSEPTEQDNISRCYTWWLCSCFANSWVPPGTLSATLLYCFANDCFFSFLRPLDSKWVSHTVNTKQM